jgi:hypothetical protein
MRSRGRFLYEKRHVFRGGIAVKKSRMNTALPPVISVRLKQLTAIFLALITAVLLTLPAFAEEPKSTETTPNGYIWEEKTADLPFDGLCDIAAGNGNIYVLGAEGGKGKYVLCVYNTDAELKETIKLNCEENENYRAVFVAENGSIYLIKDKNPNSENQSFTVFRLDGKELTIICEAAVDDRISISGGFAISEEDKTVIIYNHFYDHSFLRKAPNGMKPFCAFSLFFF